MGRLQGRPGARCATRVTLVKLVTLVTLGALGVVSFGAGCSSSGRPAYVPDWQPPDASAEDVEVGATSDGGGADVVATDVYSPTDYPPGPYGLQVGDVFPNLTFPAYRGGVGTWAPLPMGEYYDPDGARGITGVYFMVAASWCGACQIEAHHAPKIFAEAYRDRGARFVSAVIENDAYAPSTKGTVDLWVFLHGINFDVGELPAAADHSSAVVPAVPAALPRNYVIDPRTMKIEAVVEGVEPVMWACDMYAPDPQLGADGCCRAGLTKYKDGSNACDVDYTCLAGKVCVSVGAKSPNDALEAVMHRNGALPFGG